MDSPTSEEWEQLCERINTYGQQLADWLARAIERYQPVLVAVGEYCVDLCRAQYEAAGSQYGPSSDWNNVKRWLDEKAIRRAAAVKAARERQQVEYERERQQALTEWRAALARRNVN